MLQAVMPVFRPGFLAGPLGWINKRLANVLITDPTLFKDLLELDPCRIHVLGLGLAHSPDEPTPTLVRSLLSDPPRTALGPIICCWPQGLDRALRALPNEPVLSPDQYRTLVVLLNDHATAGYLHHCRSITGPMLTGLATLPKPLRRPAIFKLFGDVKGMERFVAGLKFLSGRAGIPFDLLEDQLGCLDQSEQVMAKIADLAESLPLPDRLPDPQIGSFRRIDAAVEIRSLAKAWRNCLAGYLYAIDEGANLIYLSTDDGPPVAALLVRAQRLGWMLAQIKGPNNVDLDREHVSRHCEAFAAAGIPQLADVAAVKDLLWRRQFPRHRRC